MSQKTKDSITVETAKTLGGLFRERVKRSPGDVAYRYFNQKTKHWTDISWRDAARRVAQLQTALAAEKLKPGDRVAIMLRNCPDWVHFEQAAIGLGLIVVPLYTNDRAENISYVLQDAGVQLLLIEGHEQLSLLLPIDSQIDGLVRLLSVEKCQQYNRFTRLMNIDDWIENNNTDSRQNTDENNLSADDNDPDALVTIVYTSGTTGRPKGVMLSHHNILFNAFAATHCQDLYKEDIYLSFLPLSHMLERTVGYYIPMLTGATMAFARSVPELAEDLLAIRPTVLVSVPRIYERVYNKIMLQLEEKSGFARTLFNNAVETGWRRFKNPSATSLMSPVYKTLVAKKVLNKLGGRLRLAICGGAPLPEAVAKLFIGLGLNLVQGYGLTETSPIVSANKTETNDPASVGSAFEGVEVSIGENDELLTRGPCVMMGYWNNEEATREVIDADKWFHTGDKAKIEDGKIYITGRIKDVMVLSNGEKIPPADVEMAIAMDPLVEQVMVVGEGCPCLAALVVLEPAQWQILAKELEVNSDNLAELNSSKVKQHVLKRIAQHMDSFPGYAKIKRVHLSLDTWTVDNGLITPTLKTRRNKILEHYKKEVDEMFSSH